MDKIIKRNFAVWTDERQMIDQQDCNDNDGDGKALINPSGFDSDLWYELFNNFKACVPDAAIPIWHEQNYGKILPDSPNSKMPPMWTLYRPSATDSYYRLCLNLPTFVISKSMIIYNLSGNSSGTWSNLVYIAVPKSREEWSWRYSLMVPGEKINVNYHGAPGTGNENKVSSKMIYREYGLVIADTLSPTDLSVEGLHAAADLMKETAINQAREIKKKCESSYVTSLVSRELSREAR